MSAPAKQLYYSGEGAGERVKWLGERGVLVVVTQCLILLTRTHHSYTTHTVSLRGGGGEGEGCRGKGEVGGWVRARP